MKKRVLIIQSVVLLVIAVAMFTVVSLAWLSNSINSNLGGFDINVKEFASLKIDFFRKYSESINYTKLNRTDDNIISIDNEMLLPGAPLLCRIDLENVGSKDINTVINFTKVAYEIIADEANYNGAVQELKEGFVVLTAVEEFGLPEPEDSRFIQNNFFESLINSGGSTFNLINLNLQASKKVSIYYRFILKDTYKNLNNALFKFNSSGVSVE